MLRLKSADLCSTLKRDKLNNQIKIEFKKLSNRSYNFKSVFFKNGGYVFSLKCLFQSKSDTFFYDFPFSFVKFNPLRKRPAGLKCYCVVADDL